MRGRRTYPQKGITQTGRKVEMKLFLYQCRDEVLAVTTVAHLQQRYHVDAKTAEYELTVARQNRGVVAA